MKQTGIQKEFDPTTTDTYNELYICQIKPLYHRSHFQNTYGSGETATVIAEVVQAEHLYSFGNSCRISEWYNKYNSISSGLKISRDFAGSCLTTDWIEEAMDPCLALTH